MFVIHRRRQMEPEATFRVGTKSCISAVDRRVGQTLVSAGAGARTTEPQRKSNLVHFSVKIWRPTLQYASELRKRILNEQAR